jgi:hypothetical protein
MFTKIIPEEIKEQYRYAIEKSREDRPRYLNWLNEEIETAINLINQFDKIYVLGGIAVKLIKATPTFYNQLLERYEGKDKVDIQEDLIQEDDESEVLLEYAMNIAVATPNNQKGVMPTQHDIEKIYDQLSKIKWNVNFWELSAEPAKGNNEFDQWLRTNIMLDTINVRGDGFHVHIKELYHGIFNPHNGFIEKHYGFIADELYEIIMKLDRLVYSKVGNAYGSVQSHKRFTDWMEKVGDEQVFETMQKTGKHFIQQFTEANPDLHDPSSPDKVVSQHLDNIKGYGKIFWVIPQTEKEKKIFELLAQRFGDNSNFFLPAKFKAFPLNDTTLKLKPLIKEEDKYYHFSMNLAYRNIFMITENLIKSADGAYYENLYTGNSHSITRDNYIESKTKEIFEKLLPSGKFYHSLEYKIHEDGIDKQTELDILGLTDDTGYIIEVKAGELNIKHRRGALKGLKDRITETIGEGSYQCHRALQYILTNDTPLFEYIEGGRRQVLAIDKTRIKKFYKISVTFEHFSGIAANLKYLIEAGLLSADYKWAWIVSIYDLMIFADLIESEADFKEYLEDRISLYERKDIEFMDEIDILGFFQEGNFPLDAEKEGQIMHILNYSNDISEYYERTAMGMPGIVKPIKKTK